MTDSEINKAMAEKLGWEINYEYRQTKTSDWGRKILAPDQIPKYCKSIAAAWEIVNSFKGDFYLRRETVSGNTQYEASFWNNDLPKEQACLGNEWADTAPLAICLAFLQLK